ncbi:MAG: crossover junction endodeoxyribonuclease RuvC [Candidatus Jorgensenbacteria bacterium]
MITLGIDPGSTRVGYGAVRKERGILTHLESGLLNIHSKEKTQQLIELAVSLKEVLVRLKPNCVGIEKLYFSKNQKTALEVAQARGVLVHTIAEAGVPILEFTPGEVKLAVTGDGGATKAAVAVMVVRFLRLPPRKLVDDVSDALAIAITASHSALYRAGVRR